MGMTKSKSACPYDGVCWTAGKTPKFISLTCFGLEKETPNPSQPEPPNGYYTLEQVDEYKWQGTKDGWTWYLELRPFLSLVYAIHSSGWNAAYRSYSEKCVLLYYPVASVMYYRYGTVVLGWFGPDGSEGSIRETIESIGLAAPDKVQVEMYCTVDGKQVKRIANEYDGTRVYIKN